MYEFDLKTLMKTWAAAKKRFLLNVLVAMVLGLIVSFSIPREYMATCSLASESQEEDAAGLSSLAAMAGINIGKSADAISPDLYPKVVSSRRFLVNILYVEVETTDGEHMTYETFLRTRNRQPWWGRVTSAVRNLIKKLVASDTQKQGLPNRIDPEHMTQEQEALVEGLKGLVTCRMNELDYTIELSVRAQDPLVCKTLVDTVQAHLQDFITAYRTNKARNDLHYYQQLEEEANARYLTAQRNYAAYCDAHQGTLLKAYQTEQERLENELSIALNTYTQMKRQVQVAEAKVQEKTPAFTVIEASTVPNRHVAPRRMLMTLFCMFLAFAGTLMYYYLRLLFQGTRSQDSVPLLGGEEL